MKIICHRRNTIESLVKTDSCYGVEIDLRSDGSKIILQHDPFVAGEDFDKWLQHYSHGTLILNVKEDGLEPVVEKLLHENGITDYFFLDQAMPTLIARSRAGKSKAAIRVSEYESVSSARYFSSVVDWVWIDCFTCFPLTLKDVKDLKACGFKLCLVSPELQGRSSDHEIQDYVKEIMSLDCQFEAVCTKRPEWWDLA